jgi:hypothetical protein
LAFLQGVVAGFAVIGFAVIAATATRAVTSSAFVVLSWFACLVWVHWRLESFSVGKTSFCHRDQTSQSRRR